jgi:Xaa-Pro aminopeptidase
MRQQSASAGRLAALRQMLDGWEVDGLLLGDASNRRWLSGFTGSSGWLLLTKKKALLATDHRYWEQAMLEAPLFELVKLAGKESEYWPNFLGSADVRRLAVEGRHLTLKQFETIDRATNAGILTLDKSVEGLRAVKQEWEIAAIQAAAEITDHAMAQVPAIARPGMSEKTLAWALEKMMREAGAQAMAFDIIVASGPNGAMAHHTPGDRRLESGDCIIVDMGAKLDGYHSDLTRTFHLGAPPNERFLQIYGAVLRAQEAAISRMRSGMAGKEIDSLARELITEAGFGHAAGQSLGHGVGLDIHEEPFLSFRSEDDLVPSGTVVSVEPGIYLTGWGGVRIEDLVLLSAEGAEPISHCPKDPIIV